jgi:tetratricopeptide (TPR) repeat protein
MSAARMVVTAVLLLSLPLLAGCGTKLLLAATYPAEVTLPPEIKTIAVTPFVGQTPDSKVGAEMACGLLATRLNATLGASGQYRIIERGSLQDIMKELDLADAGITDAATAAKAGKILNADAIIIGSVQISGSETVETKTETTYDKRGFPTTNTVQKLRRTGLASMTSKMVRPETSEIFVSKTSSHSYDSNLRGGLSAFINDNSDIPAPEAIARLLLEECVTDFYNMISPHEDFFEVELVGGKSDFTKSGIELVKGGMYQEAASQFEEAVKFKADDHASVYDLGVMQMILGDLPKAKENIDKALRMKPDKKYIRVSQQLKAAMANGNVTFRAASGEEQVAFKSRQKMLKARS